MPHCAACCSASLLGKLGHSVLPRGKHAQAGGHTGLLGKGFAGQMPLDGAIGRSSPCQPRKRKAEDMGWLRPGAEGWGDPVPAKGLV